MSFVQCLESSDPNALEGALDALYKVRVSPQSITVQNPGYLHAVADTAVIPMAGSA